MNKSIRFGFGVLLLVLVFGADLWSAPRVIDRFSFKPDEIALHRSARPQAYFDKVGRKFAVMGTESGSFEAWAYPLKILRNFELSFFIGQSTQPIPGREIVRFIEATPAVTTLTYVFQSFTVKASFITSIQEPGAIILLAVDSVEPLTIVCGFLPVLQPMWPAGLGGQYAYWDDGLKAYLISEPRRQNHGFIGSPAAEGISYTPAHMLSDTPNEFKIVVADPLAVRGKFIPIIMAGGRGERAAVQRVYQKLEGDPAGVYREAEEHYRSLRARTMRVTTPFRDLDLAYEWSKVTFDNLMVDNPDLGLGMVAGLGLSGTGGRPGFGWFFAVDAFFNSFSLNSYGAFDETRAALAFVRKRQRDDGKIMHELSQAAGFLDWFKDYPYGYIHGDTTPYYIVAVHDYLRSSGDIGFVKDSWPSILRAFDYCLSTDANRDGLMDNRKAGLGALEFGSLTGIETDIYMAAVWGRACVALEAMARAIGDKKITDRAELAGRKAAQAFEEKFWDETIGQYSYAFNADGRRVTEITPWASVGLTWGLGTPDRARRTLERINRSDMTTDWGVRMMSSKSSFYEPLNYNYGACWPFLAGYVASALYEHDFPSQAYALVRGNVRHTFDNCLGGATELYSGHQNVWPQEAVAHQGFSSGGLVLPFVRGLLGLEGDALRKEIVFKPRLPADWPGVRVDNFRVGEKTFSLELERKPNQVRVKLSGDNLKGWEFTFAPLLTGCRGVLKERSDGRESVLGFKYSEYICRPSIVFRMEGDSHIIEFELEPYPDIIPPENCSETGDSDQGLKIVSIKRDGVEMRIKVEGLAGRVYSLGLVNPELVTSVSGAELIEGRLRITMPAGDPARFVPQEVVLGTK